MPGFAQHVWDRDQAARQQQVQLQLAPLASAISADRQRLSTLEEGTPEYDQVFNRLALNVGRVHNVLGDKTPADHPGRLAEIGDVIREHLGGKNRQQRIADWNTKVKNEAQEYATGELPYALTPAGQAAAYTRQTQEDLQRLRNEGGATSYHNFKLPDGKIVSIDTRHEKPPPGAVLVGSSTGYIRQGNHVVTPHDAIQLMQSTGVQFPKQDGGFWTQQEIERFPKGAVLSAFLEGDKTFYAPFDQRTKTATIGNVVTQLPEAGQITPATETPLGPARTPTITQQPTPGGGMETTQIAAPVTTGAYGNRPDQITTQGKHQTRIQGMRDIHQGKSIIPDLNNVPYKYQAEAQKLKPVVVAEVGLFGDPAHPEIPSLIDYSNLANSPHAQKVLGEAFNLLDQRMGEISDPGILQTLATSAGWANFRAGVEAEAQRKVGEKMTPDEQQYFDTAIRSMADIIGARASTGQSAARFSVQSIQNELPLIGLSGTPNRQSYLNKMQGITWQIRLGLDGMPDNGRAMAWLDQIDNRIAHQVHGKESNVPESPRFRVGEKVKLKNGKTITISHVYPDGSFD